MNDIGVASNATEEVRNHGPGGAGVMGMADEVRRGGTGTDSSLKPRLYHIDDFEGRDKKFAAFFNLVPSDNAPEPSPDEHADAKDEHAYVKYFNGTIGNLADYELRDENGDKSQVNLPEILVARDAFASELRDEAGDFIDGYPVFDCLKTTAKRRGRFEERVNTIRQNNRVVTVLRSPGSEIDDIRFNVLAANLTDGQQKLIIEVQKALTVVAVVFKERPQRPQNAFMRKFAWVGTVEQAQREEVARRNYYVRKLADIAKGALANSQKVDYAIAALEAFKNEFVAREADSVKNRYVRNLGRRAALFGAVFFAAYWFSRYLPLASSLYQNDPNNLILYRYKEFFALATGACAGTWLSFAIRRVILGFTDLALLEDDRLKPTSRIFFVVGLTIVVGMLLQTHMVGFVVGTTPITLTSGLLALLIGTLCGISERALTNVVSRRADDFAGRLGGQTKPAGT